MRFHSCAIVFVLLLIRPNSLPQEGSGQSGHFATFKEILKHHHIQLTTPSLVEALRNPDSQVRYLAALTLAEDKVTDAVPEIVDALNSEKEPETKANIALALAQLGNLKGFTTLESMCKDHGVPTYVRVYATKYTLDLDDESCLDAILEVLQLKAGFGTRALALSQLPRFRRVSDNESQRIVTVTSQALADSMPDVRIAASDTLARLAATAAIPALENAITKEHDETVRTRMGADLQGLREKKDQ
jgi:HEAT repeat protein